MMWIFESFLSHLVDDQNKNVDERGRSFMYKRTVPSLLVYYNDGILTKDLCSTYSVFWNFYKLMSRKSVLSCVDTSLETSG